MHWNGDGQARVHRKFAATPTQPNMQDFRNLEVWKKAHDLALDVQKTLGRTCGFRKFWRANSGNSGHLRRWGDGGRIVKPEVFGAV